MGQRIIYDPQTGFYIDAETGEVLEEYEVVGGTRAQRIISREDVEQKMHWSAIDLWIHDNGLYTKIGFSGKFKGRYMKLARLQRRLRVFTHNERKLVVILSYVRSVCKTLNLPPRVADDVCLEFKRVYKELKLDSSPVPYRSMDKPSWLKKLIAYTILKMARKHSITITVDEVAKALGIERGSCIAGIQKFVKLDLKPQNTVLAFQDLWSRYLGEYMDLLATAVRIMRKLIEDDPLVTGKSRKALVAGLAYILARATGKGNVTQRKLAKKLGITEVTVRNTFQHVISRHEIIVEVE